MPDLNIKKLYVQLGPRTVACSLLLTTSENCLRKIRGSFQTEILIFSFCSDLLYLLDKTCFEKVGSRIKESLLAGSICFHTSMKAFKILNIVIINPLTARVVWAPKMILQPVSSIFPCSPLPSGIWRAPGLSIP